MSNQWTKIKVRVTYTNGEVFTFKSIGECIRFLDIPRGTITKWINEPNASTTPREFHGGIIVEKVET